MSRSERSLGLDESGRSHTGGRPGTIHGARQMVGAPPSGTVTFLFTDVVGSSRRWDAEPDAMKVALARHDELLHVVPAAELGYSHGRDGAGPPPHGAQRVPAHVGSCTSTASP